MYAAIASCAALADLAAEAASFFALNDEVLAYLASLTDWAAFLAEIEAAFLRLFALETDFAANLAAFLAAAFALATFFWSLATFALNALALVWRAYN